MTPKLIHFIFGLIAGESKFSFFLPHYIAVKSAALIHPNHKILMWIEHEPENNFYWDLAKRHFEIVRIKAPIEIFGNPLMNHAHKTDVLRLQILDQHGGIYLDIDTVTVKSFDTLHIPDTGMAIEINPHRNSPQGLCNATIVSRARAPFVRRWLDSFEFFISQGRDVAWELHAVKMPLILARQVGWDITILPSEYFFKFQWSEKGLNDLFKNTVNIDDCYSIHLWEHHVIDYLRGLTVSSIFENNNTYNLLARKTIGDDKETIIENHKN